MKITYDSHHNLLYIRFDETKQKVQTILVQENIILELSEDNKLVGIEILEASENINLEQLFPIVKAFVNSN